ncbi:MAG: hypothetical protein E7302_04420 [Butyrivibrio sp.]|jgi:flagellar hook-associated protein 2|nr:hypothetical protein [Butyrivibrio sp.]
MTMRITGLSSGLDTESIITELTKVQSNKVDKVKSDQKKHDMKMDKWKDLNKKVVSFYNKTLSNLRFDSSYTKKTTTSSNNDAVSITTSGSAMNSAQKLSVDKLANSAYMTGGRIDSKSGSKVTNSTTLEELIGYTGATSSDDARKGKIRIKFGPDPGEGETDTREYVDIDIKGTDTLADVVEKFRQVKIGDEDNEIGLNANYDANQGRLYLTSTKSGKAGNFSIDLANSDADIFESLGLYEGRGMRKTEGEDAEITLNGVKYTSDSNTFEINGLTITAKQKAEDITLTTSDDTSGIYDMIKGFLKEYNELIGEMAKLYNAENADEYDILTEEQKDSMTEDEIKEWNEKIEDGLLAKDATIGRVMREMKNIMLGAFDMGEVDEETGKPYKTSFASFGIATLSYFNTDENERGQWHIDGDEDDEHTSSNEDKLKAMITKNPDLVRNFFKQISSSMYSKLGDLMKSTDFSSSFTLYEDKQMKKQVDKYKTQLKEEQKKLESMEDKYYDQFAQMEKAMTSLNSKQSALSGLIGS